MKKIMLYIMTAIMTMSTLGACTPEGAGGDVSPDAPVENVKSEYQKNPIITLNGFESQKNLSLLTLQNNVGKITLNEDAKYVSEGKYSAKVSITNDEYWWTSGSPYIYHSTLNGFTGEDNSNFNNVSMLSLDVFNAEERNVKVGLQLMYSTSNSSSVEWYEIEAGKKSQLAYSVVREFLPSVSTTDETKKVIGINILFERFADKECTLYLDNYRMYKTNTPIQTMERSIKENEINSFDQMWQYNTIQPTASATERLPKITWVKDIVSPNQPNGSAIKVQSANVNVSDDVYFEGMVIPAAGLTECDFSKFSEDAYFCFDLYSPYDGGVSQIFFSMFARNTQYYTTSFANGFVDADRYPLNKGVWQTYAFKISDLNSGANVTATVRFEKTNKISFSYRTDRSKSVVFYLDNLRIENTLPEGAIV